MANYRKGDVNMDGLINFEDYNALQDHINETTLLTDEQVALVDFNEDGKANIKDEKALLNLIKEEKKAYGFKENGSKVEASQKIESTNILNFKEYGGYDDGVTPNDELFTKAKNEGYFKFYFPQNENKNASYYFTEVPVLNGLEISGDVNVVLNFPRASGIDSTKNAIFTSNLRCYSRSNEIEFDIPKNIPDYFNNLIIPADYSMANLGAFITTSDHPTLKLFKYDHHGTKKYIDDTANLTSKYLESDCMNINLNDHGGYFGILAVPILEDKHCLEIVTNGNETKPYFGILDENTGIGAYGLYSGSVLQYYKADGTAEFCEGVCARLNLHNMINNIDHTWSLPMKYKIRYNKARGGVELFINDMYVGLMYAGTNTPTHFGFGFSYQNTTQDHAFSRMVQYTQKTVPINTNLNILIAGDSRCYGYNENYRMETILKNGLELNGINKVNIDNISVSGWTLENIKAAIEATDLTKYDIVVIPTGINNPNATVGNLASNICSLANHIAENKCFAIFPATLPVTPWTDGMSELRTKQYYKIQSAITLGIASVGGDYVHYVRYLDNMCGIVTNDSNLVITSDGVHPNNLGMITFCKSIISGIINLFN